MTKKQTARQLWWSDLFEQLSGWSPLIAIGVAIVLLWLGFVRDGVGDVEARVLLVGFPAAVLAAALTMLRRQPRAVLLAGALIAVVGAAAAEARTAQVLLPPDPFDTATVTKAAPDATLDVPDSATELDIVVHADLESGRSESSIDYDVVLQRGEARAEVRGRLARDVIRGRRTRRGSTGGVRLHETEAHTIRLPGPGVVSAHLEIGDRSAPGGVRLAVAPPVAHRTLVDYMLIGVVIAAFFLQLFIRRGTARLTAAVAMYAAFGFTLERLFNPDDLLKFSLGTGLLAFIGGGVGGWLLGVFAGWLSPLAAAPGGSARESTPDRE